MEYAIPTLRDKAIMVRLTRHQFHPYVYDKGTTALAEAAANAPQGAGRYSKRLFKHSARFKGIQSAFGYVYSYVMEHTLPWMDEGMRVLPTSLYVEFGTNLGNLRRNAMDFVEDMVDHWDEEMAMEQRSLGSLFDPNDYPTASEFRERFGVETTFSPVPSSEDFRIDIDADAKSDLDRQVAEVQADCTTHVLRELFKPIQAMAEKLSIPAGADGSIFRDSLVSNVNLACSRARKLNINDDPRIDAIVRETEALLAGVEPNDLRGHEAIRADVASHTSDIAKRLSGWL